MTTTLVVVLDNRLDIPCALVYAIEHPWDMDSETVTINFENAVRLFRAEIDALPIHEIIEDHLAAFRDYLARYRLKYGTELAMTKAVRNQNITVITVADDQDASSDALFSFQFRVSHVDDPHPSIIVGRFVRAVEAFRTNAINSDLRPPRVSITGHEERGWAVVDILADQLDLFQSYLKAEGLVFEGENASVDLVINADDYTSYTYREDDEDRDIDDADENPRYESI